MKNLFFKSLMLCLCVLLLIGSVSEWGTAVRVGLIIVSFAMLVDVIKRIFKKAMEDFLKL